MDKHLDIHDGALNLLQQDKVYELAIDPVVMTPIFGSKGGCFPDAIDFNTILMPEEVMKELEKRFDTKYFFEAVKSEFMEEVEITDPDSPFYHEEDSITAYAMQLIEDGYETDCLSYAECDCDDACGCAVISTNSCEDLEAIAGILYWQVEPVEFKVSVSGKISTYYAHAWIAGV